MQRGRWTDPLVQAERKLASAYRKSMRETLGPTERDLRRLRKLVNTGAPRQAVQAAILEIKARSGYCL